MNHLFVAGFDFGTSYSKVVVRDQLTNVAKAVTFGSNRSGLLPSFVRARQGVISGPDGGDDGLLLSYPKLIATDAASAAARFASLYGNSLGQFRQLLESQSLEEIAPIALVRYFLSVLNAVHRFIRLDEDWRLFDPAVDPLVVQIAVPIGLNSGDNACDQMMQRALAAATLLHFEGKGHGPESPVSDLKWALQQLHELRPESRENLNARCITYPEVAAGVQTVLRSPNTPDGKYITMDVGAGTVDLNAFLRRRPTEQHTGAGLEYWSCEVRPLGFARLNLPSRKSAPHELSVNPLAESELLQQLQAAVHELMRGAFRYQPNRVIGGGPGPWSGRTFAYIWGGGASHPAYESTFLRSLKSLHIGVGDANRLELPSDQFVKPHDVDFGRLAIAYGLSFHKANLESVRLPAQLKRFDELYPAYWQEVISVETLCSCRGNPACLRCHGLGLIRPDQALAPALDLAPANRATTHRVHKSRIQIAFEKCVDTYTRFHPRSTILIERFLLLSHIGQLRYRPEIDTNSMAYQQAGDILTHNVRLFRGRVRVLKHSAKRVGEACQCIVRRIERHAYADVVIQGPVQQIERVVNADTRFSSVDILCRIGRTDRREFYLQFEDVAPDY
jgi:hypothetical protein